MISGGNTQVKSEKIDEDDDHIDDHDNDDFLHMDIPDLTPCHVSMTRSSSRETKCSRCKKHFNHGIYPAY